MGGDVGGSCQMIWGRPISGWPDHVKRLIAKTQSPQMGFPGFPFQCITILVGNMPY